MPVIDISSTGSNPCKFNIANKGSLRLLSATDIYSDSVFSINGGALILEGEKVNITGTNKFTGGELKNTSDTVTINGEIEIDGCIVDMNANNLIL